MADTHNKETRSYNMSQIRSKNTKPEILVRKFLHSEGFRFRLHDKRLPGKPDIVLPKYKTILFIHGCFWHGHTNCKYFVMPKTRVIFWSDKILRNKLKDKMNLKELRRLGWKIIEVWECQLKKNKITLTKKRIVNKIIS